MPTGEFYDLVGRQLTKGFYAKVGFPHVMMPMSTTHTVRGPYDKDGYDCFECGSCGVIVKFPKDPDHERRPDNPFR